MYHVVICTREYRAPLGTRPEVVFKKGEVYQAEDHNLEFRVWRNKRSFLKFSPNRFKKFFKVFC